jgi:competence protein ComEC
MKTSEQQAPGLFLRFTAWMPLLWLSLAFLAGILAADHWDLPLRTWLILAGVLLLVSILLRFLSRRTQFSISSALLFLPILLTSFSLGAIRYRASIPRPDASYIAWYNDRPNEQLVTGVLADPPDDRDTYTNLRIRVTGVFSGGEIQPVSGLLLARILPGGEWHYGDVVRVRGHLKTPPENEDFSYRDYLARQGIRTYMPDAAIWKMPYTEGNPVLRLVFAFKEHAIDHIYRIFPEPEASLLAGILLGDDNGLPATLQQAYQNTGTAHIIAISGFNIAIIAGLFIALFSRLLGPRRGAFAAVAGIALYTILVGATPSVVRAALMGGLAIFARQLGRRQVGLNTLAASAAFMAIFNPQVLWDISFQLSFAATLGLILYAQPFQEWLTRLLALRLPKKTARRIADPVSMYMLFTLAAQLTTLPIVAYQFKRISLISLLANPLILPFQPALMVLAGLAVLLSFLYLPLGQLVGWAAWPFAAYTNRAVEFFNRFPYGVVNLGDFSFLFVAIFYILLFSLTFSSGRMKKALRAAMALAVIITVLGVFTYLVWSAALLRPDGRLHLTFLDVGSADAVLIQSPSGRSILVDGGPSPSMLSSALGRRIPFFDRRIDWLVVASPEEQEVAALPRSLDRFMVENVLWAGNLNASYSAETLTRWLTEHSTPVTTASAGTTLDLGDGARLEMLSVTPRGAVLLLTWQGFRALLPAGMNFDSLTELENGKKIGPVTALMLADSGFAPVNPPEWIAALRPQVVILSVAAGDPDGLPDQVVLDNLTGYTLLRTDRNGWISVATDGNSLWVEVEKK